MHSSSPHRPALAVVAVVAVVVGVLLAGAALARTGRIGDDPRAPVRAVAARSLRAPRPEVRAAHLLADWDRRRAAAWAAGDPEALLDLYDGGSAAGWRDRAMLLAWQRRGLDVEDLRTQVVRLAVLAHRPGRFEIEVVDRLVSGTAVGAGTRRVLPRDTPTTRRVVLVQEPGGWVVDSVSAVRS